MPTASLPFASLRVVTRLLLATVLVALGLATAALLLPDPTEAADPLWACYNRSTFALRYVAEQDDCTRLENDVRLDNSAHPIWICLHPSSGVLRYAGNGSLPISSRCTGAPPANIKQIPGDNETPLCITTATGALTFPPCGAGQTPLTIPKRNTAPVADSKSASTLEEQAVQIQLSASDADGQNLTFAISTAPTNGSLGSITGLNCTGTVPKNCTANVTYTPNANFFGTDTFKYVANDTIANSAPATVTITVTNINDTPAFTSGGNVTVNEDSGAYNQAWATGVTAGPNENSVQTVSFEITNNSNSALFTSGGQPAVSPTGVLTFTPAADLFGEADITLKIKDNGGIANGGDDESDTQTFKITVNSVNDRPTFTIGSNQTVGEDAGDQSVPGFAGTFDPGPDNESGQAIADYKVSTDEDELFSTQPDISNTGTLTYTPADNASGVATIRVKVQDDGGTANGGQDTSGPDPLTFTITISAVNDAPTITLEDDTVTTLEDTELEFSSANSNLISVADVDADPDEVEITLGVDNGKLTLNSTNGLTFTPAGPDNNGVNDAEMTFTGTLDDVNAALNTMTYTPNENVNGSDTLSITIDDQGNNGSGGPHDVTDTVAITVTAVNDPPDFTAGGGVTVDEDSGAHSSTWATGISTGPADENGQTPTFTLSNNSNTGLFTGGGQPALSAAGVLTFTPAADKNGTATIEVVLSDGGGTANGGDETSATKILTINVTAVNDAPSFTLDDDQTVAEDSGPHTVTGFASSISKGPADESGQTLTFTVTNDNNGLFTVGGQPDIDETTGNLTYTLAPNANGETTVTVSLADNGSNTPPNDNTSADQTFDITVTAVNDAPVLTAPSSLAVNEDVLTVVTGISVVDVDAGSANLELTLSVPSGQGTFTAGPHSSFTVNGTGTNQLTIIAALSTINAYLVNGVSYTTALNAVADVSMTVTINDQGNTGSDPGTSGDATSEEDTATVTLDVSAINDAPSFTSGGNVSILPGVTTYSEAWATAISPGPADESTQTVQFFVTGNTNEALFTVQPSISPTGVLSFTAVDNADGSAQITVVLRDNGASTPAPNDNESDPVIFTISTNEPPTISAIGDLTIDEDANTGPIAFTINDPDGDEANATLGATSNNTTLLPEPASYVFGGSAGSRTLTVTPPANLNGSALITVTVTDEGGSSATEQFTLTVTAVNDAPSFEADDPPAVDEDSGTAGAHSIPNWATDFSPGPANESSQTLDHYTVANVSNTALFSVQPAVATDGTLTYTLAANANGSSTFDVTVTDSGSGVSPNVNTSTAQTFSLTVNPVNDPPTANAQTPSTDEDTNLPLTLTGADGDPEVTQTLTFTITDQPDHGTLTGFSSSTGAVTYDPADNYNGPDSFAFTVTDDTTAGGAALTSAPATISITVNAVNDNPVIDNLETTGLTYIENGTALQLTSALTISDVDGTTLSGATVTITGFVSGQDVLAFAPIDSGFGITGNFSTATGILTFNGTSSHANYATVLQSVTYSNSSEAPSTAARSVVFQVNDGQAANNLSATASRTLTVTAVNDAPVNTVPATAQSTNEDTAKVFNSANSNQISIADADAGSNSVKVTLTAANGTLTLSGTAGLTFTPVGPTNDGTADATLTFTGTIADINTALNGLSFLPASNFNDSRGTASLTVLTNDQGNTGTDPGLLALPNTGDTTFEQDSDSFNISVTALNDAPSATVINFGADSIESNMQRSIGTAAGLLSTATDPDTGDTGYTADFSVGSVDGVTPVSGTITTTIAGVGTVVANAADGSFTFDPAPGVTGTVNIPFTVCDNGNPPPSACSSTVNATFNISGPVTWFVDPAAGTNGTGTLASPFNTLASAIAVDADNHRIFIYTGTVTGPITLNNGEWLIGQGVPGTDFDTVMGISVPAGTITRPAINGTKPVLSSGADTVAVTAASVARTGIQIRGLSLASTSGNAIDLTASGTGTLGVEIGDNAITGATQEGIDVNAGGTGGATLSIHDLTVTAATTGIDITRTAGTVIITAFDDLTVSGTTGGNGISVTASTFDANTGTAGFQSVSGGDLDIGSSGAGNGVGGSGLVLSNVSGDLNFTDLDVFADGGTGLSVSGTAAFTGSAGIQVTVTNSVAVVEATGGPALNLNTVTVNLQLTSLKSTNSTTTGVTLINVANSSGGAVSAGSGSSISNATLNDFDVSSSTATVSYAGSISNTAARAVNVSGHSSGTITFSGSITDTGGAGINLSGNSNTINFTGDLNLSTGTSAAFTSTNSSLQGTISVDPVGTNNNVLTTTNGTALSIDDTNISANGLEFKSISANGATNGINLNNTGTVAGLTVLGTGTTDASGGVIQNTTSDGIVLTSTRFANLKNMVIGDQTATTNQNVGGGNNIGGDGISMSNADDATFTNLKIARTAAHGIDGTGVSNLTIADTDILNAGDDNEENGLDFSDVSANNLDGTVSITNTIIDATSEDGIFVENFSGTLNMTLSGVTVGRNKTLSAGGNNPFGENGLQARADGSANMTVTIGGNSLFDAVDGNGIFVVAEGTGTVNAAVTDTVVQNSDALGIVFFGGTGDHTDTTHSIFNFDIIGDGAATSSVRVTGSNSTAISIQPNGNSSMNGTVSGVTVNGSTIGRGIEVLGDDASDAVVAIDNNRVSNTAFNGIFANTADYGVLDVHIRNNNVSAPLDTSTPSGLAIHGIEINPVPRGTSDPADFATTTTLDISGNTSAGNAASGGAGYRLRQRAPDVTFRLERLSASTSDVPTVVAFIQGQNTSGTASVTVDTQYTAVANGAALDPHTPPSP